MWKETAVAYFKILFERVPERAEEKREKYARIACHV
jgi:hypothetical protein